MILHFDLELSRFRLRDLLQGTILTARLRELKLRFFPGALPFVLRSAEPEVDGIPRAWKSNVRPDIREWPSI